MEKCNNICISCEKYKGNAQKASDFQDELGAWFVDAINEKLERETK